MSYKIEDIEGIGAVYAGKLAAADITTTAELLEACGDAGGRKAVTARTGISEKVILSWANMADLMRVKGVGGQYAELLHAAGVDTIKELRTRNAENLAATMNEVNARRNLANACPGSATVQGWIDAAREMQPAITH